MKVNFHRQPKLAVMLIHAVIIDGADQRNTTEKAADAILRFVFIWLQIV